MASLIGGIDMMGGTTNYMSATYGLHRLENLTSAAIIYWAVSKVLELITKYVTVRLGDIHKTNGWEREALKCRR
jgi:ABC-type amino acid transport system permease subunit